MEFYRETPSHIGTPPHTVMSLESRTIKKKLNYFRGDIKNAFFTQLDKRNLGGGMNTKILDRLERIGIDSYSDGKKSR